MLTRTKALLTVLWIGLVAGTLDITGNLIFSASRINGILAILLSV